MPRVTVIVPSHNRAELLAKLLRQLTSQQFSGEMYLIVVNDGSTDGTEHMLSKDFPQVDVIKGNGHWWYTRSINEGLKRALKTSSDYFLLMNDDTEVQEDYVDTIIRAADGRACIMGSLSVTLEEPQRVTFSGIRDFQWWRYRSIHYHPEFYPFNQNSTQEFKGVKSSKFLPGRGLLLHRSIVEDIGFLDERLVQYASDDEYCLRAARAGYDILISWDSIVWSHHRLTGSGTSYVKEPLLTYLKSYLKPVSRNYWKKYLIMVSRYGVKPLLPLTLAFIFFGNLKSYLKR